MFPRLVIALLLAGPARALNLDGSSGDLPMSAAAQGAGALYTGYDVFRVFVNPAFITTQPRTWEVGFANSLLFDGAENCWSIAGGWAGGRGENGSFGAAVLVTGLSMDSFSDLDLLGNETGRVVSPGKIGGAVAAAYQWQFASFGGALGVDSWTLGDQLGNSMEGFEDAYDEISAHGTLGAVVTLGLIDLGISFRLGELEGLGLGLAIRTGGVMKGIVAGEMFLPMSGGVTDTGGGFFMTTDSSSQDQNVKESNYPATICLGYVWQGLKFGELRAGIVKNGDGAAGAGPELRLGLGVPWKNLVFDYAFNMGSLGGYGMGSSHSASLRWVLGAERKQVEGPRFFLKAEERTMAVAAFEPQGVSPTDAAVISDMLRNRLIKEGSFNIVEKANMDKILAEQAFQQTGCTSSECAVKLGKILNVKYLVVGSFGKALDRYVLSMRVVDVETAKAAYSDEATGADLTEIQAGLDQIAIRLTEAVKKAK